MAGLTATLIYAALATVVASAGYSAYESTAQRTDSKKAMESQENDQRALEETLYKRQQKEESQTTLNEAQSTARTRQQQLAAAASGRSSTILTSPLGVPGDSSGTRRTILGD